MGINFDFKKEEIVSAKVSKNYLDDAMGVLASNGMTLISGEENARTRIIAGKRSGVTRRGNIVAVGVMYKPNDGRFITRNIPLLGDLTKAVGCQAGRNGERDEYYYSDVQVKRALEVSVRIPDDFSGFISRKNLEDSEIFAAIAGSWAGEYTRDYIKDGIYLRLDEMRFVNAHKGAYGNLAYWEGTDLGSTISANGWILGNKLAVRGIKLDVNEDISLGLD